MITSDESNLLAIAPSAGGNSNILEESKDGSTHKSNAVNNISQSKRLCLDQNTAQLLKKMYKEQFPDIISTILRLKHSRKIIDTDCKRLVENINGRFLRTVIQILSEKEEFDNIFKRLKKEYDDVQKVGGEKQEAII